MTKITFTGDIIIAPEQLQAITKMQMVIFQQYLNLLHLCLKNLIL